jgi:hypothetical protein
VLTPQTTPPRHVTSPNDPPTPRHRPKRPPHATSPPSTTPTRHVTADDGRRQVTAAASPLLEGCRRRNRWGGSEEERGGQEMERGGRGMGKEEAGETAREGGGHASSFPLFSFFISNRGSTRCPHVFSFYFERGQQVAAPMFLFISFRTGAALAAPVSFLFVFERGGSVNAATRCPHFFSVFNRGGSVNPTRCPHSSPFRTGAACIAHAALCFFRFRPGTA